MMPTMMSSENQSRLLGLAGRAFSSRRFSGFKANHSEILESLW